MANPVEPPQVHTLTCLGMTLVDATDDLIASHGYKFVGCGPIVSAIESSSSFDPDSAPHIGCAFWIISHPAFGFHGNHAGLAERKPTTVREFAEAILHCSISPTEFQALLASVGELGEMDARYAQRWVCRVVFQYPNGNGTMTTSVRFDDPELAALRRFLEA